MRYASPSPSKVSRLSARTTLKPSPSPMSSSTSVSAQQLVGSLTDGEIPLHNVGLGDCPWAAKLWRNGERAWPASFFTVDIIKGFRRIDKLRTQRLPKFYQETAFELVFGLQYHQSTFHKHYKFYLDNSHLISKYQMFSRSPKGSWTNFVAEACRLVIDTSETEQPSTESSIEESAIDDTSQCPYCEELMPVQPSPLLQQLRMELDNMRATHQPIDATTYCQQHRFETFIQPKADMAGWPRAIDFRRLKIRLEGLADELQEVSSDPTDSVFFGYLKESVWKYGKNVALGVEGAQEFGHQYGRATG